MANTFAVTKQRRFGGPQGKSYLFVEGLLTIDTAAGDTVGDFPASLFGLKTILECAPLIISTSAKLLPCAADPTGGSLICGGGAANVALDLTNGVYSVRMKGT